MRVTTDDTIRSLFTGIKLAVEVGRTPSFVKTLGAKLYSKVSGWQGHIQTACWHWRVPCQQGTIHTRTYLSWDLILKHFYTAPPLFLRI